MDFLIKAHTQAPDVLKLCVCAMIAQLGGRAQDVCGSARVCLCLLAAATWCSCTGGSCTRLHVPVVLITHGRPDL